MKNKIIDFYKANLFVLSVLLKNSKVFSLLYIVVHLLTALIPSGTVYLSGRILDLLVNIYNGEDASVIWFYIALLFVLTIIGSLSGQLVSILSDFIRIRNDKYLNSIILDKLSKLNIAYFEDKDRINDMSIAMYSQFSISRSFIVSVDIFKNIVKFISLVCVIAIYSPLWSVLYLLTTIPGLFVTASQSRKMDKFSISSIPDSRKKDYYYSILTARTYAKELRIYNLFDVFKTKYNEKWKKILSERAIIFRQGFRWELLTVIISIIGYIVLYAALIYKTFSNEFSVGELTTITSATLSVALSFSAIINTINSYVSIFIPRINITREFLGWREEGSGSLPTSDVLMGFDIEFKNVTFKYPNSDNVVLSNVSFKINRGEKIAIVGVNGAGKTTIIKLLLRFYEPNEGQILLNGIDIKEYSLSEYRKLFSVCFQNLTTYSMTLRENVALSDIDRVSEENEIWNSIFSSGLEFKKSSEITLDTPLTRAFEDSGFEPSGGQRQKIVIARAFFRNAPFVILDEPSSALDPIAEDRIFGSFSKLCGEKSGILISHRLSNIIMVDKIIYLESGSLLECGTHKDLMALKGRYAEMYHLQADKYDVKNGG